MICSRCGEQIASENREDLKPSVFRVPSTSGRWQLVRYEVGAIYDCQCCGSEWEWTKGRRLHLLVPGVEVIRFDKPDYSPERMHEAFEFSNAMDGLAFEDYDNGEFFDD